MSNATATANRKTADQYRAMAKECRDEYSRSWEDSDSDGYLSQWANQQMSSRYDSLADIADDGWTVEVRALFDLEGNVVPARHIEGKYGWCWAIIDPENPRRYSGFFNESNASTDKVSARNNAKKGYVFGTAVIPVDEDPSTSKVRDLAEYWDAEAVITSNGQDILKKFNLI